MLEPRIITLVKRPKVGRTDGKLALFLIDEDGKETEILKMPSHI
jgi:hypothetical protein